MTQEQILKPIENKLTPEAKALYAKAQRALRANLDRVLSVSKDTENMPSRLTQVGLSEMSGVARSTVTKVLSAAEPSDSNPDLRTLCRLAETLGVPPAFLLMAPEDWSRLASAIAGLQFVAPPAASQLPLAQLATEKVAQRAAIWADAVHPPGEASEQMISDQPLADRKRWKAEMQQRRMRTRQSVKAMAVVPNWGAVKGDVESLFSICILMGAATSI